MCLRGLAVACGAGYGCTADPGLAAGVIGDRFECGNLTVAAQAAPASVYCPAASAGADTSAPTESQPGYYTVGGRATCSACGAGQILRADGTCGTCVPCGRHEYTTGGCTGSTDRTCEACHTSCTYGCTGGGSGECLHLGTYLASAQGLEEVCDTGHYCTSPASTTSRQPCPAGTYGASVGLASAACDGPCMHGYYCPAGSTRPDAQPCDDACFG